MKPEPPLEIVFPSRKKVYISRGDPPEQVVKTLADAAGAEDSADRRFLEQLTHNLDKLLKGLATSRLHRRLRRRLARPFRPEELQ